MSVYTTVTTEDLDAWLARYMVGGLVELAPIASGIENTNYFVTTEKGRYVLTLYERLPAPELPFYLNLMAHLARAGVEVPAPEPDRTGALFSLLNGKPAGLVARIDGESVRHPSASHCAHVGAALARLHVASQSYRPRLANRRGPSWWPLASPPPVSGRSLAWTSGTGTEDHLKAHHPWGLTPSPPSRRRHFRVDGSCARQGWSRDAAGPGSGTG